MMVKNAAKTKSARGTNVDASIAYPIAGCFLLLVLLPIYAFLVEVLLTGFNEDWVSSIIASYYEDNYSADGSIGVISILQKIAIPIFAGLSANKLWTFKHPKLRVIFVSSVATATILVYAYDFILSWDIYKERIEMFNISVQSLKSYFSLYKDPLLVLLATLCGLEFLQKNKDNPGTE